MEPSTSPAPAPVAAPTAMDVVTPPKLAAEPVTESPLATPPPQEAAEPGSLAAEVAINAATPAPQPVALAKVKAPKSPGVDMAITATAIIIMVIAGLAVLAFIKR